MSKMATTHWGQNGDLHTGTLDECQQEECQERRALVLTMIL